MTSFHRVKKIRVLKAVWGIILLCGILFFGMYLLQLRQGHPEYIDPDTVTIFPPVDAWVERTENDEIIVYWKPEAETANIYITNVPTTEVTGLPYAQAIKQN